MTARSPAVPPGREEAVAARVRAAIAALNAASQEAASLNLTVNFGIRSGRCATVTEPVIETEHDWENCIPGRKL